MSLKLVGRAGRADLVHGVKIGEDPDRTMRPRALKIRAKGPLCHDIGVRACRYVWLKPLWPNV